MFGLRLVSRNEILMFKGTIEDLRAENDRLRQLVEHERKRSEGAINALLIKVAKVAITPDSGPSLEEQEKIRERQLDIFGDGEQLTESEALERLQS